MTYKISGKVMKGDGYGRKIGFPTVNLDRRGFSRMKEKPLLGVYKGKATMQGKTSQTYRAGIIIGPIDKKGLPKIEAHLIGWKGDAYGKVVSIEIGGFIRKFKNFKTEKELITQIKKDLAKCR